jgi:DNA-binding LacI/PurR family transcriptional regulator
MTTRSRLTLGDLAASLGVSKTTVSNAFSRPDQLSADLRARILEAAYAAGYAGPDPVARMLRTRRAGSLGLILPESLPFSLDDPTTTALLRGIADACDERRLGLLIVPGGRDAQDTRSISDVAVDGFIAYSLPRGAAVLDAAVRRGVPLVVIDQPRMPGVTTVSVDDHGGAREAARHLVRLGHRRIAIVALPFHPDGYTGPATEARIAEARFENAVARLEGYREAFAEVGIDPTGVPVFECAHSDEELGLESGRHFLGGGGGVAAVAADARPTAILAMSDRMAIGILQAARAARVDVPRDVSVVGFNDSEAAARSRPALTTVRQPLRLKGYAAARLILDAPSGASGGGPSSGAMPGAESGPAADAPLADATPPQADDAPARVEPAEVELDLPVELVVRRSTAAPRRP